VNKTENKKEIAPFVTNISEIYQQINFYKKGFILATTCVLIEAITVLFLIFSNPIVIQEKDGERIGYIGEKKELVITEKEIKEFVRTFIKRRYEWSKFSPELIASNLSNLTNSNLTKKIIKNLKKEEEQLKGQKVQQYIGKIVVSIDSKNQIVGTFDKILRIGNIPLLSEAQVLIGIVKGLVTKTNKLGLYINSVVNYEVK
jgi:hypothetical protein